jgi:hypothetical protein
MKLFYQSGLLRKPGPVRTLTEPQKFKNNAFRLKFSLTNYPIHQNQDLVAGSAHEQCIFKIINE